MAYDPESKREQGTLTHSLIDMWHTNNLPLLSPPKEGPQRLAWHGYKWLEGCKASGRFQDVHTEQVVGINWSTGQAGLFTVPGHRQYPNIPGWQFGTADLICRTDGDTLYIGDWKTGDGLGWEEQVLSLLYAISRVAVTQDALPPKSFIGACLRLNDQGCWPEEIIYTQNDLDLHADAMRMRWEDIQSGRVTEKRGGIHCTQYYCPHLAYCSEIRSYVSSLARQDAAQTGKVHLKVVGNGLMLTDKPRSDTEAGEVVEMLSAAKRQIKYLDTKMKEYVAKGGRVLSGQMEWKDRGNGFRWGKANAT